MPMLRACRALDDISFVNNLNRLALFLVIASAFGDEQHLATWMDMPIQPSAGSIGREGNTGIECAVAYVQFVQPNLLSR